MSHEIEGQIDTIEKLHQSFNHLQKGKLLVILQEEIPDFPENDVWEDKVAIVKAVGPSTDHVFFVIGLVEDTDLILEKVREMIEHVGGRISGEGLVN